METKIPTNQGDKTTSEVMDTLMWGSYKANRASGCTHAQLVRVGIGNEMMKTQYERQVLQQRIISNLRALNPEHSVMANALNGAAKVPQNFHNLVDMVMSQYYDNPLGMEGVVGSDTMGLIIDYHSKRVTITT